MLLQLNVIQSARASAIYIVHTWRAIVQVQI